MDESSGIQGQVVTDSGEALGKATVSLTRSQFPHRLGYRAITDDSGAFLLDDVEPGQYQLTVVRNGYVPEVRGWFQGGTLCTLEPGVMLSDVTIRMVRHAVMSGRLTDGDGEPVGNHPVELLGSGLQMTNIRATTNDLGEFRLAGISPGWHALRAAGDSDRFGTDSAFQRGPQQVFPPFYFPGTTDEAEAVTIKVNSGEELRGLDLKLPKVRAFRIRGRVVLPEDAEPRSVHIQAGRRHHMGFGMVGSLPWPGAAGDFEFGGLLPGFHDIMAHCSGTRPRATRLMVEITDHDVDGLVIRFPEGVVVEGSVRPVAPSDRFQPGTVHVGLVPIDGGMQVGGQPANATGEFQLFDVAAGRYRVGVHQWPEEGYAASVKYGGREVIDDRIELVEGAAPERLEVLMAYDGGEISGVVQNAEGGPAAGAGVHLVQQPARLERNRFAVTDQDGRFWFHSLRPGEYRMFAIVSPLVGAEWDEKWERLAAEAQAVVVIANGKEQLLVRIRNGKNAN